MQKRATGLLSAFQNNILGQINKTSEIFQNTELDINAKASALILPKSFISSKWDNYEKYEMKVAALYVCNEQVRE